MYVLHMYIVYVYVYVCMYIRGQKRLANVCDYNYAVILLCNDKKILISVMVTLYFLENHVYVAYQQKFFFSVTVIIYSLGIRQKL